MATKNHEIPEELWDRKNVILKYMERLIGNNEHENYKHLWKDFAQICQSEGKKLEELINKYEQPVVN